MLDSTPRKVTRGGRKMCIADGCVFISMLGNGDFKECQCDDGSQLCPYGRAGIEGTMLIGDTRPEDGKG